MVWNTLKGSPLRGLASGLMLTLWASAAWGWGVEAHRLIGELAERQLQPAAAAEVRRLLSAEPGATMGSVAAWADEVRGRHDAAWHYVNMPPNTACQFVAERDCPGGACVVGAIERQLQILGSTAPDDQRRKALKYLIHFVGDVHQPLHAGRAEDRGGNTFQLQAFGRGTNLHALWDTGLIANAPGGLAALQQALDSPSAAIPEGSPATWAEESCRAVEQAWFYPAKRTLEESYLSKAYPVLQQQIQRAAARLAAVLNRTLGR